VLAVNGQVATALIDDDERLRRFGGDIGLQLHAGLPMKVEFRRLMLRQEN
jgi:hypothetical protein